MKITKDLGAKDELSIKNVFIDAINEELMVDINGNLANNILYTDEDHDLLNEIFDTFIKVAKIAVSGQTYVKWSTPAQFEFINLNENYDLNTFNQQFDAFNEVHNVINTNTEHGIKGKRQRALISNLIVTLLYLFDERTIGVKTVARYAGVVNYAGLIKKYI